MITFEKALRDANTINQGGGYMWIRPRKWNGSGTAIEVSERGLFIVPKPHLGENPALLNTRMILDEPWEVVAPRIVNNERKC